MPSPRSHAQAKLQHLTLVRLCSRFGTPSFRPRRKEAFLAKFLYGWRQRSIAPSSDLKTRFAGLLFAPDVMGQRAECRVSAGVGGIVGAQKVRTRVRTGRAGLHPKHKNG